MSAQRAIGTPGFARTRVTGVSRLVSALVLALAATGASAGGDAAEGRKKAEVCAQCHGPDGNSPAPAFPHLAGQHADYIVHALAAYKSGARSNAIMAPFAAQLTKQDREDLAAYFASQPGLHTIDFDE